MKREIFLKQVEQAEILNKDFFNDSYEDLFSLYFSVGHLAKEKITKAIITKIKSHEVPTPKEIKYFNQFWLFWDFLAKFSYFLYK